MERGEVGNQIDTRLDCKIQTTNHKYMNIAEILKRKGIIKRSPAEIAAFASRASLKTSPLVYPDYLPPIPPTLKWLDILPSTMANDALAYAWIAGHYVIRIKKNPSGKYRDKHLVSLHTFYDNYNGKATINPEPLVSRWHEFHFTEDIQTLNNVFDQQ